MSASVSVTEDRPVFRLSKLCAPTARHSQGSRARRGKAGVELELLAVTPVGEALRPPGGAGPI